MSTPVLADTDPAVERLQLQLIPNVPAWRRAEMAVKLLVVDTTGEAGEKAKSA